MNKLSLIIAFVAISLGVSNAQDIKLRTSFHLGAMAEFKMNDKIAIQPELLYSAQGAKFENFSYKIVKMQGISSELEGNGTFKLNYINIPVMVKYYVMEGLSLEAGPQIGFLVSAKQSFDNLKQVASGQGVSVEVNVPSSVEDLDVKKDFSTFDLGFNLGASYTLDFGLNVGLRYNLGLTNILSKSKSEEEDGTSKNGVFQLSVGYFF